jgi:hypothetical protein
MTRPHHASLAPILALALELTLSGPAAAQDVRAADYDAFWLWAGVAPQAVLARARSLYILQGQVEAPRNDEAAVNLIAQGGATPRLHRGEVWLVYRAHTLNWTPAIYAKLRARLDRWRRADNPVVGVQIDFDARTRHLDEYARFLRDLRARLPADCRLSITGLLDWSSQGDPAGLAALGGVVDEVVLQTYQGRRTIPDYGAYLSRIGRVRIPFKIGLVQGGEWTPPPDLAADPWFRGYVVFLQNPVPNYFPAQNAGF